MNETIEYKFEFVQQNENINLINFYKKETKFVQMGDIIDKQVYDVDSLNLHLYYKNNIIGAATYKQIEIEKMQIVHLHLLCIDMNHRQQSRNNGTKLINQILLNNQKIILWTDKNSSNFFEKNKFVKNNSLGYNLQNYGIKHTKNANFYYFGFSENEITTLMKRKIFSTEIKEIEKQEILEKYGMSMINSKKLYQKKMYCILISKKVVISKLIKYLHHLLNYSKLSVSVEFSENEKEFYLIKFKFSKKHKIYINETNKRFYTTDIETNLIDILVINPAYKHIFLKEFIPISTYIGKSMTSTYMEKLLSGKLLSDNNNFETIEATQYFLKKTCNEMGIDFINESACSHTMILVLLGLSKHTPIDPSFLFSVNQYMKLKKTRACDGLYVHDDILVMFEFKNNVTHNHNSLAYIDERDYADHLIEYIYINNIIKLLKCKKLRRIGIEFYGKNKDYNVKIKINNEDIIINDVIEKIENVKFTNRKTIRNNIKKSRNTKTFKKQKIGENVCVKNDLNNMNKTKNCFDKVVNDNNTLNVIETYFESCNDFLKYKDEIFNVYKNAFLSWGKMWIKAIENENNKHLLALKGKEIIGVLTYSIHQNSHTIIGMCITECYRNCGIGTKLFEFYLNDFQNGNLEINLESDEGSVKFYDKFGFKNEGDTNKNDGSVFMKLSL